MGKPRLIIVVRHAQSEGNKNREIHQTIPDHRVKLTPEGWKQAHDAGCRLRDMLNPDDTLQFFTSPYRRTRETTEGILSTLTADEPEPSPWKRNNIKVYEEPRLREQDFGNFQPCSSEMERMWQERADYGHFFYRIPNGESAADAYDRVSGFNESLWRQFGEPDFPSVCVLVTHGLMSRVFLMKWYHFTVEYFEDLRNVNHCEFLVMRLQDNGRYLLENKLRTWSDLRRERMLTKDMEDDDSAKLEHSKTFLVTRRWGGCPGGCNHRRLYSCRDDLELLRQSDAHANNLHLREIARSSKQEGNSSAAAVADSGSHTGRTSSSRQKTPHSKSSVVDANSLRPSIIDTNATIDDMISSPDGTPSFITIDDRLRSLLSPKFYIGRDGGGTYSGHVSLVGSDDDEESDWGSSSRHDHHHSANVDSLVSRTKQALRHDRDDLSSSSVASPTDAQNPRKKPSKKLLSAYRQEGGIGRGMHANRLGDESSEDDHMESPVSPSRGLGLQDGAATDHVTVNVEKIVAVDVVAPEKREAGDDEDLAYAEREDRSIQGSVY